MTARAASASWSVRARSEARIASSTRLPIRSTLSLISRSARSRASRAGCGPPPVVRLTLSAWSRMSPSWRSIWVRGSGAQRVSSAIVVVLPGSAEAARDVVLGEALVRVREDLHRVADLDEVAGPILAHREERGAVAHPRGLLHIVGHDDDG